MIPTHIIASEIALRIGEILSRLHPVAPAKDQPDDPMNGHDTPRLALLSEEETRDLWKAAVSVSERIMSTVRSRGDDWTNSLQI